jgi:hypothetical protein
VVERPNCLTISPFSAVDSDINAPYIDIYSI